MMYFQFTERPEEIFEKNLEFRVLNAQLLHIRNILLGSFKVGVLLLSTSRLLPLRMSAPSSLHPIPLSFLCCIPTDAIHNFPFHFTLLAPSRMSVLHFYRMCQLFLSPFQELSSTYIVLFYSA